jgi:hypothetical protein
MPDLDPSSRTVIIKDPTLRQFEGGFTAIPNRILENRDLTLGARMTYSMLLKYAWQKDFCWPAQERIAVDLGVSDRSVRTFLKELRENHLITWKQRGLNKPNIYYLLKLPDTPVIYPGPAKFSGPDRNRTSGQDRQPASDKEYTKKNTKSVNVISTSSIKNDVAEDERQVRADYVVAEILAVCGDENSIGFYRQLIRTTPTDVIYQALSATRHEARTGTIRTTRGAFFTAQIRRLTRLP